MTDPLDDRLTALGAGDVPPLAPAGVVRARGDQRRTRARAALGGGAAALVLLAGGGAYAALSGPATVDRLDLAVPSPSPTSAVPSASPSSATTAPSAAASASPRSAARVALSAERLLQPADAERVAGGDWSADPEPTTVDQPVLRACAPTDDAAGTGLLRDLRRGPEVVTTQVVRHAAASVQVLQQLRDDVRRCPSRPEDSEDGKATVEHQLQAAPVDGAVSVREVARDCPSCAARVRTWVVLAGSSGLVSYTALPDGELGRAAAWARAAAARLDGTAAPAATTSRSASPSPVARPASDRVLTVQDADRAEPGDWRRTAQDLGGPVLDPCRTGTFPRPREFADSAATVLAAEREAGGTGVEQSVVRYRSEAAAQDAAASYVRAVRECASHTERGYTVTYEVEGTARLDGVATTFVRRASTRGEGYPTTAQHYAVQQSVDLVSVVSVGHGEDGDPGREVVEPFAREVARKLVPEGATS